MDGPVEYLSEYDLCNESDRIVRGLAEGRSFVLTDGGVPVGKLIPIGSPEQALSILRPARRTGGWSDLGIIPKKTATPLAVILDELRADRQWDAWGGNG